MLNSKQFKLMLEDIQSREEIMKTIEIASLLKKYGVKNFIFTPRGPDGYIDVDSNVNFCNMKIINLPFKFGKIKGDFICYNCQLISLKGAPQEVKGEFNCSFNQLTNLEGAPKTVG